MAFYIYPKRLIPVFFRITLTINLYFLVSFLEFFRYNLIEKMGQNLVLIHGTNQHQSLMRHN